MYKKILIAVAPDHPESVDVMLRVAKALAAPEAKIEAFSVVSAVPTYIEIKIPKSLYKESADAVRQSLETRLEGSDVVSVVEIGRPSEEIEKYRKRQGHDLIIMRSNDPSVKDYIIGSTASRVVGNVPCSVHVIR